MSPVVKPLKWSVQLPYHGADYCVHVAQLVDRLYMAITEEANGECHGYGNVRYPDIATAKKAIQAEYAAYVLSLLEPTPTAGPSRYEA